MSAKITADMKVHKYSVTENVDEFVHEPDIKNWPSNKFIYHLFIVFSFSTYLQREYDYYSSSLPSHLANAPKYFANLPPSASYSTPLTSLSGPATFSNDLSDDATCTSA
jgi:hypothetical protein